MPKDPVPDPWAGKPSVQLVRSQGDVASLIRFIVTLAGVVLFAVAGGKMLDLESVAENTVAEEFYNLMGLFSLGMACLILVVGMPRRYRDPQAGTPPIDKGQA